MSHTNTTTNYGLPQFLSSDKPAWMADINVAFADIDTQMKLNADAAADAQSDVNDASLNFAAGYSNASTYDVGDVVVYNNRMYICDVAVTVPESFDIAKWTYYRVSNTADAVENLTSAENALESLVGSTDISAIGDGTVTGAIDTINTNLSGLNYTTTTLVEGVSTNTTVYVDHSGYDMFEYLLLLGGVNGPRITSGLTKDKFVRVCFGNGTFAQADLYTAGTITCTVSPGSYSGSLLYVHGIKFNTNP